MAIAMISMIAVLLLTTVVFYNLFQNEVIENLHTCADMLGEDLVNYKDTNRIISQKKVDNIRVTLIDKDGVVLADSDVNADVLGNHKERPEVKEAIEKGSGKSIRTSNTLSHASYYYAIRLSNGNILRLAKESQSFFSFLIRVSPFIGGIAILLFVVSIFLSRLFAKSIVKPIEMLAKNMDREELATGYKELTPFLNTIQKQHRDIVKNSNMRQEFTANVSHELKTPISAIMMSLQLLEDKRVGVLNEEQGQLSKSIKENSQRLLEITGELLNMTQVEAGKLQMMPKITKPIELIEYAIKANQVQADKFNIQIEVEYPEEKISKLFVDSEKIAWVLTNLLSNAIRYSKENGRVVIGAQQDGNYVELYVQDFGKGIDPRYHQSIFDRYFRVPGTKVQGSGLGLAISKDFVEAHGGTLSVDSAVGKGSTFVIKFNV